MELQLYQINAFTNNVFGGNPACVVPLTHWLDDGLLLKIAKENAVAETAFFINKDDKIHLRWFTPEIEMDLCGHATLATAHCLSKILKHENQKFTFETLSGDIIVEVEGGFYSLNLPSRMPIESQLPHNIKRALNIQPKEILKSRDFVLVYDNETEIRNIKIDLKAFNQINLGTGGLIVTAKGDNCDFVSRFFTPQSSILEDPATGSAHCSLIPYWSSILNKNEFYAKQISERLGELYCTNLGERVVVKGQAKTYSIGSFFTE